MGSWGGGGGVLEWCLGKGPLPTPPTPSIRGPSPQIVKGSPYWFSMVVSNHAVPLTKVEVTIGARRGCGQVVGGRGWLGACAGRGRWCVVVCEGVGGRCWSGGACCVCEGEGT